MNKNKRKIELADKLIEDYKYLSSKIDFSFLDEQKEFTNNDVKRYYKKTKYLLYRLFGSSKGYMHIDISDDGVHTKGKNYQDYQVKRLTKIINEYNCKDILEIGSGQSANLKGLAKSISNLNLTGIDLNPCIDKKTKKYNIDLIQGDYHDLSKIPDNSIDLVYAIETMCYSNNKNLIFEEVNRVLKKDGLFVISDAYLGKERKSLSEKELFGASLVEKGYYLNEFEFIGNIDEYIKNNNFNVIINENMKPKIINHLYQYKNRINGYLKLGILFKLFAKIIPKEVLGNIIPVYFMANTIDLDLSVYIYHVLQKEDNKKKIDSNKK